MMESLDAARKFWQRATLALLAAASIVAVWIEFLPGHNFPPETVRHPIADHALPLLRQPSCGSVSGRHGPPRLRGARPPRTGTGGSVWLAPLFERRWIRTAPGSMRYGSDQQIPPEAL